MASEGVFYALACAPQPQDAWNARVYQLEQPSSTVYDSVHESDVDGDNPADHAPTLYANPSDVGGGTYMVGWSPRSRTSTLRQPPCENTYSACAPVITQPAPYEISERSGEMYESPLPAEAPESLAAAFFNPMYGPWQASVYGAPTHIPAAAGDGPSKASSGVGVQ